MDDDLKAKLEGMFTCPVDIDRDADGNIVVGVILDGVEYAFHLVDCRNAD